MWVANKKSGLIDGVRIDVAHKNGEDPGVVGTVLVDEAEFSLELLFWEVRHKMNSQKA